MNDDIATDVDADLGFEPAVSATGADAGARHRSRRDRRERPTPVETAETAEPGRPSRRGLRRRLSASAVLLFALLSMGGVYAAFAGTSGAAGSVNAQQQTAMGRQLFEVSCITCHGANLQGVHNHGPALISVGGASVYFQVSTGRMPLAQQGAHASRKTARFDEEQTRALAAYVQSVSGGPNIPMGTIRGADASISEGGVLFRLNCAACHGTTFKGAPLSAGKNAPSLNASTDLQMYTAMLSGPESMPIFSDNQLTPKDKKAIIAYVQTIKASDDPGGSGIDRIGPVSEAIVLWTAGVGVLMVAILWIGAKQQ